MPTPTISLKLSYVYGKPIALKDLTASLNGFAAQYKEVQKRTATAIEENKAELYITSVREGSIIAELTPYVLTGMTLIETANTVGEFATNIKAGIEYFLGKIPRWTEGDKKSAENIARIIEPIAKDSAAQLNITGAINVAAGGTLNITVNSNAAREIKRTTKIYIQELQAPGTHNFDSVDLLWYQARNDSIRKAGDRAIIPDLSDKPVKVMFASDVIKARMLNEEAYPFKRVYSVDVTADFKGRQPTLYRITRVRKSKAIA